jgi:23S rRNA pseudouridine1911/1915/1917 synthase
VLPFKPNIIYEDNHLIAINKPSGILVQGDNTHDIPLTELMKEFIKIRDHKPGNVFIGLIHRLDRPVSGLVLLAKTSKALERMNKLFSTREVTKTYLALVKNKPQFEKGELTHHLVKNEKENFVKSFSKSVPGSKEANLEYRLIQKVGSNFLLEVTPHTGRSHQIRVQLSSMGCPIIGDTKYGSDISKNDLSINLHSWKLNFIHPVTKIQILIESDLPIWAIK